MKVKNLLAVELDISAEYDINHQGTDVEDVRYYLTKSFDQWIEITGFLSESIKQQLQEEVFQMAVTAGEIEPEDTREKDKQEFNRWADSSLFRR